MGTGKLIVLTDGEPEPQPAVVETQSPAVTPGDVLRTAIEKGADVDQLERLLNLELRWRMYQAELAYQSAFTAFKLEPGLKIYKDEIVDFESKRTGGRTEYRYSPLDKCEDVLIPLLAKHGITHHWKTEPLQGGSVKVTAVLTHLLGHKNADASLLGPPDQTGSKNAHQAIGSNVSYLQRYTLCAACGITPRRIDTDAMVPVPVEEKIHPQTLKRMERQEEERKRLVAEGRIRDWTPEERAQMNAPNLEPILRESLVDAKFAKEKQRLEAATNIEELMKAWAGIGKDARKALVAVKDQCKANLESVCK